ncbi:MAG TPA: matrixin family metalloprotease [Oculatellaceae cyanobacterium]
MQNVSWRISLGALFLVLVVLCGAHGLLTHTSRLSDYAFSSAPRMLPQNTPILAGNNYLADVTEEGRITWSLAQMPLRVYIEDGSGTAGYQPSYPDFIRRAFDEWQRVSNSKVSWVEVNNLQAANIVCSWTSEARTKGSGVEAGATETTIRRNPFFGGGQIISAHVVVLTCLFGRSFSASDIYKTCLHEIGHALGMQGHSSTVGDIMYPVLNPHQTPYLKDRDRNTITALYSVSEDSHSVAAREYAQQRAARWQFPGTGFAPTNQPGLLWNPTSVPFYDNRGQGWYQVPMRLR